MGELKIYRSRQPVTNDQGQTGYLDFWSTERGRAIEEATCVPGRKFEELTLADILQLPPRQQFLARVAWVNAYGE